MNVDVAVDCDVRHPNGLATVLIRAPEVGLQEIVDIGFEAVHDAFGEPDPRVLDLVLLASVVYVLDKGVPRRQAEDAWTRDFSVRFPVSAPRLWDGARTPLEECLTFLTGDEWDVGF